MVNVLDADEARSLGYLYPVEYWVEMFHADPPRLLDGAWYEVVDGGGSTPPPSPQ